jgi:hypothetical protein
MSRVIRLSISPSSLTKATNQRKNDHEDEPNDWFQKRQHKRFVLWCENKRRIQIPKSIFLLAILVADEIKYPLQ